jgi:hypothetical protein
MAFMSILNMMRKRKRKSHKPQATSHKLLFFFFFFFCLVGPAHKLFSDFKFMGGTRPQALLCDNLSRDKIIFCFFSTVRHIVTCDNSLLDVTFEQHCCHTATGCANQRTRRQHALFCGSRTRDL